MGATKISPSSRLASTQATRFPSGETATCPTERPRVRLRSTSSMRARSLDFDAGEFWPVAIAHTERVPTSREPRTWNASRRRAANFDQNIRKCYQPERDDDQGLVTLKSSKTTVQVWRFEDGSLARWDRVWALKRRVDAG